MEKNNRADYRDYRFDTLAYALRKENSGCYSFSSDATWFLSENDETSTEFEEGTWNTLWKELHREYEEKFQ
jgi:hypothetical protein